MMALASWLRLFRLRLFMATLDSRYQRRRAVTTLRQLVTWPWVGYCRCRHYHIVDTHATVADGHHGRCEEATERKATPEIDECRRHIAAIDGV